MELTVLETGQEALRAGYSCGCGCTPVVEFARGDELVEEGCCCGNRFAVGPRAAASLTPKPGFRPELHVFDAPWGEPLQAAWLVGPSVHAPDAAHDHHAERHHDEEAPGGARVVDPVCGMTVETQSARAKDLHATHAGTDYFFCGKGCMLEFADDPERFLDPSYVPSM